MDMNRNGELPTDELERHIESFPLSQISSNRRCFKIEMGCRQIENLLSRYANRIEHLFSSLSYVCNQLSSIGHRHINSDDMKGGCTVVDNAEAYPSSFPFLGGTRRSRFDP